MDLVMTRLVDLEQVHTQKSSDMEISKSVIKNKTNLLVAAHALDK